MVKKKESIDRVLMVFLNLLLSAIVCIIGFGGKQVIKNQRDTVEAVNELRVVLTEHNGRINANEDKNIIQDGRIKENEDDIEDLDKRVYKLEK